MSCCNICLKQFGFFTKEFGCPLCKFTYCKKCLSYQIEDENNSKKKINVCLRCFHQKTKKEDLEKDKNKDLLKIDETEKEIVEKIPVFQVLQPTPLASAANSNVEESVEDQDDAIKKRLNALKAERLPPSEETANNIESRLAELKGMPLKDYSSKKVLFEKDTRSEAEKIEDLVKQFVEERDLDQTIEKERETAVDDIERRLAELRGPDYKKSEINIDPPEETESDEEKRLMRKYIEEAKLEDILDPEEKEFMESIPKPPNSKDIEELPFCELCNEDATLRCIDCEDLFCGSCFKEFHYEEDYRNHKTVSYKAPKKQFLE